MPDSPGGVTLIRPDGSRLEGVAPESVAVLKSLRYREETEDQRSAELGRQAAEDHYTTPGQKLLTGVEGGLSGASLGATDLAFGDSAARERASYNPGIRLGSELVGGFYAPVGILGKAAEGLAESKAIRGALRGAVEGAQYGAGSAITNAQLSGDPQSVEAIAAGVGWGGIFGGGLGYMAGKVGEKIESAQMAERKALEKATQEQTALGAISEEKWGAVRGSVTDARAAMDKAVESAGEHVEGVRVAEKAGPAGETRVGQTSSAGSESAQANEYVTKGKAYVNELTDSGFVTSKNPALREAASEAQKTLSKIQKATKAGDLEAVQEHLAAFEEHLSSAHEEVSKIDPSFAAETMPPVKPELPILEGKAKRSVEAMVELADMANVSKQLKSFPVTAQGVEKLSPKAAETLGAAIDKLGSLQSAELQGVKTGVQNSINDLMEHLGVPVQGSPGTQFRGLWETLRASDTKAVKGATEVTAKGAAPWWQKAGKRAAGYAAGYVGEQVASKMGAKGFAKFVGYEAGKNMLFALLNIKGAVLGHMAGKVADWAPKAALAAARVAPRVEPLKTRLDGTLDNVNKSRTELMQARAKEIRESAMGMPDTLYKSLQPVDKLHPDLAVGLHQLSVNQFKELIDKLPQDPGHAFSALKSLWKPDEVATEKFSRYYEVFHDPVGVISKALETHKITLEAAEGLQKFWPELYSEFRGRMLERISDPKVASKLSYNDQVHLGLLLGLPLHSTMTPHFIASQMQMFTERNQKLPINPQTGAGGSNGGRPSGNGATAAQKVEQH